MVNAIVSQFVAFILFGVMVTVGKIKVAYWFAIDVISTFLFIHSKQFSSGTNIATMYIPISVALRSEKNVSPENISL